MSVVAQDPTDPAFAADPYPFYQNCRALGDFVFWSNYDMPMATTHMAVSKILRHPHMGRAVRPAASDSETSKFSAFQSLERHSLLEIEPPDHTRIRRHAMKPFTGSEIALVAPRISQFADRLIDAFPAGSFDLIEAYAKPLAAQAITEFLGVDVDLAHQLQTWSNQMVAMYQARRDAQIELEAEAAASAFARFMRDMIAERRATPGTDFISQLIDVEESGEMTVDEVVSTAILLLNAGHEATAHTVGNAVPLLLAFEGQTDALAPESIAGTIEECLRFCPPLHLFKRYVYEGCSIEDTTFAAGDQIGCLLASANRDDAVWPDGGVFNPFRARVRHLGFGVGLHACLGAALARLELQIALPVLFARCPELRIEEPPTVANLYHFHGYERLLVSVR